VFQLTDLFPLAVVFLLHVWRCLCVPYPIWFGSSPFRDRKAQERGVQSRNHKASVWKIVFIRSNEVFVRIQDLDNRHWKKTGHYSKLIGQGI
jgi:hypothetical protein